MAHDSKLDAAIYLEFANNWTELSYQAQVIKAKMHNCDVQELIADEEIKLIPPDEYQEQMMKTRIGQYFLDYQY